MGAAERQPPARLTDAQLEQLKRYLEQHMRSQNEYLDDAIQHVLTQLCDLESLALYLAGLALQRERQRRRKHVSSERLEALMQHDGTDGAHRGKEAAALDSYIKAQPDATALDELVDEETRQAQQARLAEVPPWAVNYADGQRAGDR